MVRLIYTIISFCLFLGVSDALVNMTIQMAGMAAGQPNTVIIRRIVTILLRFSNIPSWP